MSQKIQGQIAEVTKISETRTPGLYSVEIATKKDGMSIRSSFVTYNKGLLARLKISQFTEEGKRLTDSVGNPIIGTIVKFSGLLDPQYSSERHLSFQSEEVVDASSGEVYYKKGSVISTLEIDEKELLSLILNVPKQNIVEV